MFFFPSFPLDLFFLLNYDLNGGNILGDGSTEGFLMGTADQPFVFGAGKFLPAPGGMPLFGAALAALFVIQPLK